MRGFNSIEYWTPASQMKKRHSAEDPNDEPSRVQQGLVYAAIGLCVGCVACVLLNSLEALHEVRYESLKHRLEPIKEHDTQGRWKAFLPWYFIGLAMVLGSTGLCYWWPAGSGSGVPDVMAYLNGVMMINLFNIKTLLCKVCSCILAVAGGLPVGPEGPMIHIGALVGAGVGSGRSATLHLTRTTGQRGATAPGSSASSSPRAPPAASRAPSARPSAGCSL